MPDLTAKVVGLLALRSTEFIELQRMAQALSRERELRPVYLVHRGSPIHLARRSLFENGDVQTAFVNLERARRVPGQSALWRLAHWDLETVRKLCNKSLVLEQGRVRYFGAAEDGIKFYESTV